VLPIALQIEEGVMGYRAATADIPLVTGGVAGQELAPAPATCLKICVLHEGRPVIQVSFPAYAIANLFDLIPHEVRPRVAAHALDLEELAARRAALGCPPGELFTLPGRHDTVRAWME
jgi:hypothetical protein